MWEEQRSIGEAERKFVLYKIKPPKLQSHQTQSVVSKFDGEQYYDDGSGYWKFSAFRRFYPCKRRKETFEKKGTKNIELPLYPIYRSFTYYRFPHSRSLRSPSSLSHRISRPATSTDDTDDLQHRRHRRPAAAPETPATFNTGLSPSPIRHFHIVLKVVLKLSADIIKPDANYNDDVPEYILNKPRYYPMFKDCIGAIDGTHGTAHDTRIFNEALQRPDLNFPYSTGDKYYVVDAGYPNTRGWELLRDMHVNYKYKNQVRIVIASMVIHNYIRKFGMSDEAFNRAQQESYNPVRGDTGSDVYEEGPTLISWNESRRQWIGDQSQRSPTERMPEDPVKRSKEHLILFIQEVLESIPLTAEVKLSDDAYEILILKF
ncbi:unnamed protein product [Lactuca virosa]|uniref:DDE Tnp4 domain-containing protein n=1 Tax=Lactuca virosa TaxID=75947 RepID=A0AAU9P541_9ASTR|nr:unnamed protein product [Lactuca virosa]